MKTTMAVVGNDRQNPTEVTGKSMRTRRSLFSSIAATFFGCSVCTIAKADDANHQSVYLHIYSELRGTTYDQDKQNRKRTQSSSSPWVRVVTLLVIPNTPVFLRLPGGRDPDITLDGRVDLNRDDVLHTSLSIAWDDAYLTEKHTLTGVVAIDELHPSSTIHCRYVFSHSKDPYDVLDLMLKKTGR